MNLKVGLVNQYIFMFEEFGPENPFVAEDAVVLSNSENELGVLVMFICNTSFESKDDGEWFYSEITFTLAEVARIHYRCEFIVECDEEFGWGDIYQPNNIKVIVSASIKQAIDALIENCKKSKADKADQFKIDEIMVTDEQLKPIIDNQIDIFNNTTIPFYQEYEEGLETIGMHCPVATNTQLGLNVTFLIIDQVIYSDLRFNRIHNREVFFKWVPEIMFNTLKLRSGKVKEHPVSFNEVEVTWLLRCMDCATQLMLGDYGDRFISICEERGVNAAYRSLYFKSITEFFKSGPHSTSDIYNDDQPVDWNKVIK